MWRFPCLIALAVLAFTSCAGSMTTSATGSLQVPAIIDDQQTVPAQELVISKSSWDDARILSYGPSHVFYSRQYIADHPELRPHAGNMTYHGGPVQTPPNEYILFYGRSGKGADRVHDPDNVWAYGYYFLKSAEGSPWLKTVTQYYDRKAHISDPRTQLRGAWWTKTVPPNPYTTHDIARAAIGFAKHVGYSPNANYIIMTPFGYKWPGFGEACAYHSFVNTSKGKISYTVFPYIPEAGQGCGAYSVNANGIDDGVAIGLGHEAAEAQTDPYINAWYGPAVNQNEIADKCAWLHLQDIRFPNGEVWPVQPLWSNKTSHCVDSY